VDLLLLVYNIGSWAFARKDAQLMVFQTRSAKTISFAVKRKFYKYTSIAKWFYFF